MNELMELDNDKVTIVKELLPFPRQFLTFSLNVEVVDSVTTDDGVRNATSRSQCFRITGL